MPSPMTVKFVVPGPPQGKGRPKVERHGDRNIARTPDQTVLYENLVRTEYRRQCGQARFGDDDALDLRVVAYYAIPRSVSKKKRLLMQSGIIRPTKRPDYDNVGKIVSDSLNEVAFKDDAQVVDGLVRKFYSDRPRVVVTIRKAGQIHAAPPGDGGGTDE